jgi:hypothetical protein
MRRVTLLRRLRDPMFVSGVLSDMVVISYDLAILFLIVVILIRASKLRAM